MTKQKEQLFDGSEHLADSSSVRTLPAVIVEPPLEVKSSTALAELREQSLAFIDKKQMVEALNDYADRRTAFYHWLLTQLRQGVHYGVPPGIKQNDADPTRWTSKPSLYKAGADFICDLMGLREEYEADMATWEMLGKPATSFIRRCRLFSRSNGKLIGEGTGARANGAKSMDINGSIKMADKCAKVAAVINSYGLSDLFTQDLEDLKPEEHANPEHDGTQPHVNPRNERGGVTPTQLNDLKKAWFNVYGPELAGLDKAAVASQFDLWCRKQMPEMIASWNPQAVAQWTPETLARCMKALP